LVVGTESKLFGKATPKEDRLGLPERPQTGSKGIGRLSSPAGPTLMMLVSEDERRLCRRALGLATLENPYLLPSDIMPVATVDRKLFEMVPELSKR
jgi:hypothetical protein